MKTSVIKRIFDGLGIHRKTTSPESKENLKTMSDIYNELKEKLSPELLTLHQKYIEAIDIDFCDEIDFYFSEGFKLGLLIGIETLC